MLGKSNFYWIFFLGALCIFSLTESCRPKDGQDIDPVDSTAVSTCILLSEKVNNILLRTYEYDSTRKLVRMFEYSATEKLNKIVKRYTFEYNSKNTLTRLRETNLAEADKSFIYELDYLSSGKFKAIRPFRVFNSGARIDDTLNVFYGENKRISELKSVRNNTSKWTYDSIGNVKKWFIQKPKTTTDSLVAEYATYDDKVNIYAFSTGIQLLNLLKGQPISKRNALKYTLSGQNVEATYQYNTKGVPTQAVLKFKSADNSLRETVYAYELNCK